MFCSKCGNAVQENERFCGSCGAPSMQVENPTPPPSFGSGQPNPTHSWGAPGSTVGADPWGNNTHSSRQRRTGPQQQNWYAIVGLICIIAGLFVFSFSYIASLVLDVAGVSLAIMGIVMAKKLNGAGRVLAIVTLVIGIFMLSASLFAVFGVSI